MMNSLRRITLFVMGNGHASAVRVCGSLQAEGRPPFSHNDLGSRRAEDCSQVGSQVAVQDLAKGMSGSLDWQTAKE